MNKLWAVAPRRESSQRALSLEERQAGKAEGMGEKV